MIGKNFSTKCDGINKKWTHYPKYLLSLDNFNSQDMVSIWPCPRNGVS